MIKSEIIAQMPKVELHCHLDGSLSLSCIKALAKNAAIPLPDSDEEILFRAQAPENTQSLLEYLSRFDFVLPLLQTAENLELAAYDVASQAAADNIKYIEIRFAPSQHLKNGLTMNQAVQSVIAGCARAEKDFDLQVNVLVCGMKHETQKTLRSTVLPIFSDISDEHLVGFDLAGDELNNPISKFRVLIEDAAEKGIQITLHAGECPHCANNMLQAAEYGATRLGHGVCAREFFPDELEKLIADKTILEMAPTSNFQTKAVKTEAEYPFKKLYDAGVHVTLNTDNRTVSATNLNREYERVAKMYPELTTADFEKINHYAIDGAFIDTAAKEKLHEQFKAMYKQISE